MAIQQAVLHPAAELHLISSFIAAAVCIEIVAVFVTRKRSNQGGSAAWIRVFIIFALSLIIVHVFEVIIFLTEGDGSLVHEYIYRINLLVVDVETIFLFRAMDCFDRFKRGGPHVSALLAITACLAILAIHVIEFASSGTITLLPRVTNVVLAMQSIAIPAAVAGVLLHRSDVSIRNHYRVILLGLILAGTGDKLHMYLSGESLSLAEYGSSILSAVSSSFLVAGLTLFFVTIYMVPYIEDLYWRQALVAIFVIDTKANAVIFKQDLRRSATNGVSAGSSPVLQQEALIGGISGIDDFVTSIIESPQGKLEYIDKEGVKMLLSWRKDLLFLLVVDTYLPVMKAKLDAFNDQFCKVIGDAPGKTVPNPVRVEQVREIAESIFSGNKGGEK
jgi:hypothetical protein